MSSNSGPLTPGEVVAGKYQVEKLLGEGGMGSVFVATNTALQRQVALKVMSKRFSQLPAAVDRFKREAIAASKVSHSGIVQVFDAGNHEGALWIAMELLEGESLGERLERGPMNIDEVMKMAIGTLSALAEVHENGIVHRDLKPDNIFLSADKKVGFVPKILDFGIAKDTSDGALSKLTATGAVVGTAYYLSPEQAKGQPDIDARADVYAMGVVLFECLSGAMPYEADTITQLIAKMFTEPPRLLAHVAPNVPSPVADVVTTCLQQDREHRYHTARGMLQALETADAVIHGRAVPHAMSPHSQPGISPNSAAALGMAGTAMGHMPGGQVPSAPGFVPHPGPQHTPHPAMHSQPGYPQSQPGMHPQSQPGMHPQSQPGMHPQSQPGMHPQSQPGMQGQIPMTVAGMPQQHPGLAQTGYMHPGSVPGVAPVGSMPGVPMGHAPPQKSGGKGMMIAIAAVLFLFGAVATGGGAWYLSQNGDAGDAVANVDAPIPADAPPVVDAPPIPPGPGPAPGDPPANPTVEDEPDPSETDPTPAEETSSRRRRRRRSEPAAPAEPDTPPTPDPQPATNPNPQPDPTPVRRPPPRARTGLTHQQVQGVINQSMARLTRSCYERRVRRVPDLRGVVTIGWVVRPDGRPDNIAVLHNGTGDSWLARCTSQTVGRMRFPTASNGQPTPVRQPFTFSQ